MKTLISMEISDQCCDECGLNEIQITAVTYVSLKPLATSSRFCTMETGNCTFGINLTPS